MHAKLITHFTELSTTCTNQYVLAFSETISCDFDFFFCFTLFNYLALLIIAIAYAASKEDRLYFAKLLIHTKTANTQWSLHYRQKEGLEKEMSMK